MPQSVGGSPKPQEPYCEQERTHRSGHPSAEIVEFLSSEADRVSQRAAIGCYAIEHLVRNPSFGRVMLMKACYLSETHLGLYLGWQPMRQAAGPWDLWIEDFESLGKGNDWFTVTEKALNHGHSKIEYSAKKGLKAKAAEAVTVSVSKKPSSTGSSTSLQTRRQRKQKSSLRCSQPGTIFSSTERHRPTARSSAKCAKTGITRKKELLHPG
jgi:hypothetical protein